MKRFIIVGLGNFGASVAATLCAAGYDVAAIDTDAERVDQMARKVTRAAVGDGSDLRTLKRIGADDANAAVISTGDDITASALTALVMRDLGIEEIYVKVVSYDHARLIEKIGVTETIFPEHESGMRLAKRIAMHTLLNYVQLSPGFGVQEMAVPEGWIGKTLRELELPRKHGISVVAVHDMLRGRMQAAPDPDAMLTDSDTLLVAGTDEALAEAAGRE